ncbi:hypothetical protein HRbin29_02106 [bacterium HR29]|jgi:predicted RNase H-like nuclease|nr:hypothetical protein HRbin29_02106 [bacterium HR29]
MRVAGLDATPRGWAVVLLEQGRFAGAAAVRRLADAFALLHDADAVAADIPLAAPPRGVREAEVAARRALGRRASTLFLTPPRAALAAASRAEATAIARELGAPGVSAQAWALRGRILEAEAFSADPRLIEAHPELSFAEMSGAPLAMPKHTWNGLAARLQALNAQGIAFPDAIGGSGGSLPPADLVDAAAAAWTAARWLRGLARPYPPSPPRDATGSGIIWA